MRTTLAGVRRTRDVVQQLTQQIRELQERGAGCQRQRLEPLPLAGDGPRVPFGAVHEWFAGGRPALPTLSLFLHLTRLALAASDRAALWVGRRVWPYPHALLRRDAPDLLDRLILLDADRDAKLWALDLALRSPAMAVVVGDGSGLGMSDTRRLQLAAEAGGAMALLWRPWPERQQLSAAATRWLVQPTPSPTRHPRWSATLLRDKTPAIKNQKTEIRNLTLEWSREQGLVTVPADVVGRPDPSQLLEKRRTA